MLMDDQNFKNLPPTKIRSPINFLNPRNFLKKSANYFFLFYSEEEMFTIETEDERELP